MGIALDACCVLNLYASGRMAEILRAQRRPCLLVDKVADESMWVYRGGDGEDAREREPVDTEELVAVGLLEVVELSSDDEVTTFVDFAAVVDDGEAATVAVAVNGLHAVATDDQAAMRLLRSRAPKVEVLTTSGLIRTWAERSDAAPDEIARVLRAVRERGHFQPPPRDPNWDWWRTHATDELVSTE